MRFNRDDCCVLNGGAGAWAFEPLANQLSAALAIDVTDKPRRFNYLLHVEDPKRLDNCSSFVPIDSIHLASDKRLLAQVFLEKKISTPQTILLERFDEVQSFVRANMTKKWCLKYPTSCGASGHRTLSASDDAPPNWPKPYVVQEFIELKQPEVYRTYCAGGEMFGWVARRFPTGSTPSPWVAHARGARYVKLEAAPEEATKAAKPALTATGLWDYFGCVDLLRTPSGEWVVLEVGTDGLFNHVIGTLAIQIWNVRLKSELQPPFGGQQKLNSVPTGFHPSVSAFPERAMIDSRPPSPVSSPQGEDMP